MLDIHSHILPEFDDGAKTIETTLEMLHEARADGTKKIVATPHYCSGYYEVEYKKVCEYVKKLNEIVRERKIDIEVLPGQEVFLDKYTLRNLRDNVIGTIGSSSYMLVEFPMGSLDYDAIALIYELKLRGIRPIVAHPERYVYVIENHDIINKFIDEHCLFQINSGSLTGVYGKSVQRTAEHLIENGICNFIGSDAHSVNRRRPQTSEAMEIIKKLNRQVYANIKNNNELLLKDEIIEGNINKIKTKKSFLGMFRR